MNHVRKDGVSRGYGYLWTGPRNLCVPQNDIPRIESLDVPQSISASRRNFSCNLSRCVYTHRKLPSYHQNLFPNMPSRVEYYYVIILNHYPIHFIHIYIYIVKSICIFHDNRKGDLSARNERRSVNLALTSRNVSEA